MPNGEIPDHRDLWEAVNQARLELAELKGMKILKNVIADGVPAYKCAFYGGDCYYAKREAEFEERRIVKAEDIRLVDLNAEQFISESEEPACSAPINAEFE